jgi:SPP1 family phage portal protein
MPRFKAVSPLEVIAIYDCSIEENLIGGIRHWKVELDDEDMDYIEYYTANKVIKFTSNHQGDVVGAVEETEHFFGDIPLVIYENNHDCVGDFVKVVDLIDALDKVVSDSANDFEMFSNSIMVIKGVDMDEELFNKLKTMRLMNLVGDAEQKDVSAEYLYKDIPDQALENYKNRLVDNIHMFSGVPNMNDENFANNLSGVAIQFKLSNLEFKCATKESYFRKGLLRRIELICNLQGLMGKVGETKDIIKNVDIRFTRNVINNTNEMIQQAIQLSSIVSKETVLENLAGLIPDVEEEKKRLNTEREESIEFMQDYGQDEFGHKEDENSKEEDDE